MPSNISVAITADITDLKSKVALAKAEFRNLSSETRKLSDEIVRNGSASAEQLGRLGQLTGSAATLKNSLSSMTVATRDSTSAFKLNAQGVSELRAAGINFFQGWASGISLLQSAATESTQILGGLIQGGVGLKTLVGPIGAIGAAATLAAGTLAYFAVQAYQARQSLAGMSTDLLLTGRLGSTSFEDLNKQADQLAKRFGISKAAAAELLETVTKEGPNLSQQAGAIQRVAEMAATLGAVRRGGGEDVKDVDIAKQLAAAFLTSAGAIGLVEKSYNKAAIEARQYARDGKDTLAIDSAMRQFEEHIKNQAGGWVEAKKTFDAYWTRVMLAEGSTDPRFVGPKPPTPTERPSAGAGTIEATAAEAALLAEIRQRESSGVYDQFHATGQRVTSLEDVERLPGKSHAFGAYGFQPGTYREMGAITGRYDLSPASQDANAVQLLRKYGPNATQSWAASGPYNTAGLTGAAAGDAAGAAQKAEEQRQQNLQKEEIYQRQRAILNRHSLDEQLKDAEAHYDTVAKQEGAQSQKAKEADVAVRQKKAEAYDADTNLYIDGLNAKQAAAVDFAEKLRIQDEKMAYRQQRGSFDRGGGYVDKAAAAQDAIDRANLVRQQGQQGFQLSEQGAASMRSANADIFRGFQATQETLVRIGQMSPMDALNNSLAESKLLAGQNATQLQDLMSNATALTDRTRIYWAQWAEGTRAQTEAQQLLKQKAEETRAAAERWAEPLKSAFGNVTSTLQSSIGGLLDHSKSIAQVEGDLARSAAGGLVNIAGSTASKVGAGALANVLGDKAYKPGEGIDTVLSNVLGQQLTELLTHTGLLTSIATNTGATAAAAGAAGAGAGAAGSIGAAGVGAAGAGAAAAEFSLAAVAPWAIGGLVVGGLLAKAFHGGGVVRRYSKGGWVVPAAANGSPGLPSSFGQDSVLSALEPDEMVLPKGERPSAIAEEMAANGGGGNHYHGPTYNISVQAFSPKDSVDAINKALRLGGGRIKF